MVDDGVGFDDLFGQLQVVAAQGLVRQAHRLVYLDGHVDQLRGQVVQLISEDFAH